MIGEAVNEGFFEDSVKPILDLGMAELVSGVTQLLRSVRLEPAPGHTPGSTTMSVESRGERALFVGDVLHHPLQIFNPTWNSIFCEAAGQARASRLKVLEQAAESEAILVPAHFAGEHAMRIERASGGFRPAPI